MALAVYGGAAATEQATLWQPAAACHTLQATLPAGGEVGCGLIVLTGSSLPSAPQADLPAITCGSSFQPAQQQWCSSPFTHKYFHTFALPYLRRHSS